MRFSCGHLGAVADSDNEQVFKLEGVHSRASAHALAPGPYLRENGNPSIPENLVMTSPYARSFERTLGEGEGSQGRVIRLLVLDFFSRKRFWVTRVLFGGKWRGYRRSRKRFFFL